MQALERKKQEGLILLYRHSQRCAELLTAQRIFDRRPLGGQRKGLSHGQSGTESERASCIQRIVAKVTEKSAVHFVGARLGHNVDGGPAGPAQLGGIVATVDLEFLHRVLA